MQRIKKVAAVAVSGLMAGATLAMPVMAEKTIGDVFGSMTTENSVVVVGANAAVSDVVAAIGIAAKVGQQSVTASVSGGSVVTEVTGGVSLDDPNDKLYLNDPLNKVKDSLTSKDLPTVLAKGTLEDDEGTTYDYNQYIELGNNKIQFKQFETDEDPVIAIEMKEDSNEPLYTYRVDFNKVVDFKKLDSDGRNVMAGNSLELGGTTFTISAETSDDKLVLYKASDAITLNMGEETTVTVEGNSYTIKVIGFDTNNDEVVVSVNGATDSVKEGRSRTIGGLEIYAKTVTAWNNGADGIAILQVGSQKIILQHNNEVMVGDNEDPIDGTWVKFVGNGTVYDISGIEISVFAPDGDNDYIPAGGEFTDPVFGTFKVKFADVVPDLKDESRDKIAIRNDGDSKGYVEFKDKDGEERKLYWVYDGPNAGGDLVLRGSASDENIYVVEGASVVENEITFLAPGNERYTHIVKVDRIYSDATRGYVEFVDVLTGEKYKTKEGEFDDATTPDKLELIVDGKTYIVEATADDGNGKVTAIKVYYDDDTTDSVVNSKVVVYPAIELNNGEYLAITTNDEYSATWTVTDDQAETLVDTVVLPTGEIKVYVKDGDAAAGSTAAQVKITDADGNTLVDYTATAGQNFKKVGAVEYVLDTTGTTGSTAALSISLSAQDNTNELTTPALLIVEEEDDNNVQNAVIIAEDGDTAYASFKAPVFTDAGASTGNSTSNSDVTAYLDVYGTYAEKDSSDNDHTVVTVYYPDTQMYARVALGEDPQFGGAVTGSASVSYLPVTANFGKLDTEVTSADKTGKKLILVGGPAINSLVAELADAGKTITLDQWRTDYVNKAIVQVVEDAFTTGKCALIVAGYEAQDTRNAAAKLLSGEVDDRSAVVISGDTVEDLNM